MQSSVDVGAGSGTREGVLDVEEDNIPSISTSARAPSLPARNGLAGRIHIPRTLVRYVHLPLSTPIKRTVRRPRTADRRLLPAVALNIRVSAIISHLLFVLRHPARSAAAYPPISAPHSR
jgi:hypothetical protein